MISSTSSSSLDFIRTLRMAGYGLLFLGPSQHLWFNFMSKVLPKRDVLTTFKKIFMGQAVYGPANTALFFSYNAALQGEHKFYFIMISLSRVSCVFPPSQGYREAVIGQFFIISHLYKSVEATPEPSTYYQCLYLDQFGLMAGLHLFDTSESLALSWMLLAAGILCASYFFS
ncbi:PXMP2/4 family protein [Salix suchowensis]|nr:PXMP2/4 family protein [Salix suchowensis]